MTKSNSEEVKQHLSLWGKCRMDNIYIYRCHCIVCMCACAHAHNAHVLRMMLFFTNNTNFGFNNTGVTFINSEHFTHH